MKRSQLFIILFSLGIMFSSQISALNANKFCASISGNPGEKERIVLISTEFGDIKIKLYNETPLHRDNFIKLAEKGFYNELLFHRVIKDFMIQGGDPDSKNATPGQMLGNGGPGYEIPAEFNPKLFHKKGALAAARESDQINPEKKSSGSQFYLVQGKVFDMQQLAAMEDRTNQTAKIEIVRSFIMKPENASYKIKIDSCQQAQNFDELQNVIKVIEEKTKDEYAKVDKFFYTDEQKKAYSTIGGTPHLDGAYTVFGEVVEGLDVIDKIAAVETGPNDRPVKDLKMTIKVLN
ncbi:MAG: peptidylprolyl isomerase [Bacteroidales bacterium]|nr:peptidylprolyl isomerase [Bacteroidales bacterium]MCF8457203.1 peptidylprolyl isomerase [Bacteroidales bacterium]